MDRVKALFICVYVCYVFFLPPRGTDRTGCMLLVPVL